ncbi:hypothetical protein CFter6_1392 [Collimonas fungivorans]|uniref:Uncharacterized protein n=1 Tax=Collimonas fungivorans TaxID=158899 RepID=A0A127P8F8_9BURK|nr:hypothetical protein CFter6_1392 [Collimonas fungivorans]
MYFAWLAPAVRVWKQLLNACDLLERRYMPMQEVCQMLL